MESCLLGETTAGLTEVTNLLQANRDERRGAAMVTLLRLNC